VKIEYLADGSTECPLIRLYRFDRTEVQELAQLVKQLSTSSFHEVSLKDKSWVESVGGCGINLRLGERDEGIRQCGPVSFECVLSSDGWNNVGGLLESFCESNATSYQWLINTGKISLLLSHNGQW
jgi:hypothetical protein